MKYIYTGVFFDAAELDKIVDEITKTRLFRMIENPHVTFAFKPSRVNPALFGQEATFEITGYACDGKNQGVQVFMRVSKSSELMHEFNLIQNPHITISVAEDGKPVDTGKMTFKPFYVESEPLTITGKYGGFCNGKVYYGEESNNDK